VKVLVTGATGLLGSECVRVFSQHHHVVGLARHKPQRALEGLDHFEECDISDHEKCREVMAGVQPSLIIHTAAVANVDQCERDPDQAHKTNVMGTENIARFSGSAKGCALIMISSDYVFDGNSARPYREDDHTGPINVYGQTKKLGEKLVQQYVKESLIVRTCWLFGRAGSTFMKKVLRDCQQKDKLEYVGDKIASPTHVQDLAQALLSLVGNQEDGRGNLAHCGIVHIANQGKASWLEYAREILRVKGELNDVVLEPITQRQLELDAPRPLMTALDTTLYTSWAGKPLRSWQEAVRESVIQLQNVSLRSDTNEIKKIV